MYGSVQLRLKSIELIETDKIKPADAGLEWEF